MLLLTFIFDTVVYLSNLLTRSPAILKQEHAGILRFLRVKNIKLTFYRYTRAGDFLCTEGWIKSLMVLLNCTS